MDIGEALEIVYELALDSALDPKKFSAGGLVEAAKRQHEALAIIHDFIVNGEYEEEE